MQLSTRFQSQQGAALVISLIMLFILTLLGVAGLRNTALEEKMASNMRQADVAFQTAETGARAAEVFLRGAVLPEFDGSDGRYHFMDAAAPSWDQVATWLIADLPQADIDGYGALKPRYRYFVEELRPVPAPGASRKKGEPLPESGMYRIVSHGTGVDGATEAIIEAVILR